MVLNSLAVLAALSALSLNIEIGMAALADFQPLAGRGQELDLIFDGKRVRLIDEAYNANPTSMAFALELLGAQTGGRRIAVLGEMLELGEDAASYHDALAAVILDQAIDRIYVIGALYLGLWKALPDHCRGIHADRVEQLWDHLRADLQDGDTVIAKGSHGSGIHALVTQLKCQSQDTETVEMR
ncbi:hypothetical protein A0U87_21905 [Sphingobium sp. MP9-4]|uniref:glutamate ligase domain-containing protein n=1 Tax=Sphingobium sp. MP9-4 TaxID=1761936 RepID=UPI0010CA7A1D|nr:cyanophycin synthetase [Sphingobium sp. MP9-4]TKV41351.1 hypothetical protein A0U87_21905 [Sphingobium sp. MP9-4]